LLLPIVFFLAIRIGPAFYAFWMSLHKWDPIAITHPYVGLDNFRNLRHDDGNGLPSPEAGEGGA
jgi:multiple sugar transport system permease protein